MEETDLPACAPVEPDLLTPAIERLLSVSGTALVVGSVIEGRDWEQLAEDCGLSVAAARKRVQRALARTRVALTRHHRSKGAFERPHGAEGASL